MKRGEIYYIDKAIPETGSEQRAGRPAIIVSNDRNNQCSTTVEVVYLTTQPKTDLPTHVTIRSAPQISTALCEQVHTVAVERVGNYVGRCSDDEMYSVENALLISLGIDGITPSEDNDEPNEGGQYSDYSSIEEEYTKSCTERDVYKHLYEELLKKLIRKEAKS